jgi:PAS domain S-box-containing protein
VSASDVSFRELVESVRDYAICMLDASGRVLTWNAGAERIIGYRADEVTGRHVSAFYLEEEACECDLEVAAREGHVETEGWRIRKDGTRFRAHVVINAIRDPAGDLVALSTVTRDLTAQVRAEAARRAAEERFRLLVESVRDYAIFMLDPSGHVVTWNFGAERLKGYRPDEVIGRHFSAFYPAETAGNCARELELAASEGRFEDEGWRIRKDGTRFWANVVITAVRDGEGTLVGFAKVTRDLTERRRLEDERAARLAAERASQAKDQFLAILGHELRNPLAPITTALQLMKLRNPGASREQEIIERQLGQMMRLIDDLLDVSRIIQGKVALKKSPFDLRDAIAKAIEIASPLVDQRHHKLAIDVPREPLEVNGDEARLTQVFANLLMNAAKYTDVGGHIDVVVRDTPSEVVAEIRDDGIGIDAALLPRVFDIFEQGRQASTERSHGGLGLGLALVRAMANLHGGSVSAASDGHGHGSTFTVRLPRGPRRGRDATPTARQRRVRPPSRRVLVVDDNEDALMLLAEALAAVGHDVRTAADADAALRVAKDFHPEVAVLDIGLPEIDGYELAVQLRTQAETANLRLIALTGYGHADDMKRGATAGFDAYFVKPVDVARIYESIANDPQ